MTIGPRELSASWSNPPASERPARDLRATGARDWRSSGSAAPRPTSLIFFLSDRWLRDRHRAAEFDGGSDAADACRKLTVGSSMVISGSQNKAIRGGAHAICCNRPRFGWRNLSPGLAERRCYGRPARAGQRSGDFNFPRTACQVSSSILPASLLREVLPRIRGRTIDHIVATASSVGGRVGRAHDHLALNLPASS